jgi:hypothetical protein
MAGLRRQVLDKGRKVAWAHVGYEATYGREDSSLEMLSVPRPSYHLDPIWVVSWLMAYSA